MSFTQQMVSSIKNNDRRKQKHIPFEQKEIVKKGTPINSKKYSVVGKHEVEQILKDRKDEERQKLIYKIIYTLIITTLIISITTFLIKFTFF